MKKISKSWLLVLATSLSACTLVGPDYQVPDNAVVQSQKAQAPFDLGDNQDVSAASIQQQAWWTLYQDPILNDLIDQALAKNTDLRLAYHNLMQAYESQLMAESANEVVVSANAAAGRGQLSSEALALQEKLPVMNLADAKVGIGYQVDLFGKLKRATESATASTEATQALLDSTRLTIITQVAQNYLQSCHASHELAIAKSSLSIQKAQLDVAKRLHLGGRGNEVDVARASAQTEALRATLPTFEYHKASSLYQLAALLGRTPGDLPKNVAGCDHAPQLSQPIPVGNGTELLKRRPDIRQAERQLAAATAEIGVATAQLYPEINLGAGFGYTGMLEHMGDPITRAWDWMPSISWHIPTGVDRARIRAREAGAEAALARFDGVVLNALRETQTALKHYEHELHRHKSLRQARDAANDAADYSRRLYREGRLTYLETLDTDRTLAQAQAQLANSEAQLSALQVQIFLALGGGWETQQPGTTDNSTK